MPFNEDTDPNQTFIKRLDGGEAPLRILLSQKYQSIQGVSDDRGPVGAKAVQPVTRPPDELIPKKTKKFITFYDMGLKFDSMLGFVDELTTTVDPVYDFTDPGSHGFWQSTASPTITDLDALRAEVIDYDPATIDDTRHRQIGFEEGQQLYNVWLGSSLNKADTDIRWQGEGWKVTQAELDAMSDFTIGADDLNISAVLTGSGKNHITSIYDHTASSVAYSPKAGDKFFLMPSLSIPASVALYRDWSDNHYLGFHAITQVYPINTYNFSVTPRMPLLSDISPYFLMDLHPTDWQASSGLDAGYPAIYLLTQFMQTYGVNNDRREAVLIPGWSMHDDVHYVGTGYPPAPQFPSDGSLPTDALLTSVWRFAAEIVDSLSGGNQPWTGINGGSSSIPTGALLAVVKQGTSIFYVWK